MKYGFIIQKENWLNFINNLFVLWWLYIFFMVLTFPSASAIQALHICSDSFIRAPSLSLYKATFFRFTFAARKGVSTCFNLCFKFALIANTFEANHFLPFFRLHLLVRHKGNSLRLDFAGNNLSNKNIVFEIGKYAA